MSTTVTRRRRIVVGITGATGGTLAVRILERLAAHEDIETHLVLSAWGKRTLEYESDVSVPQLSALAHATYKPNDMAAAISSGSFLTSGMIVVPCSMKTLSGIARAASDDLISRAADVHLKERRRLVLVTRETPLNEIHLDNMMRASRAGAVIFPPVLASYGRPETLADVIDHLAVRALDQLGIHDDAESRWNGDEF